MFKKWLKKYSSGSILERANYKKEFEKKYIPKKCSILEMKLKK